MKFYSDYGKGYSSFQETFMTIMTKRIRQATMLRSKMKNTYNEKRTEESLNSYKKQRNFCVNLL